MVQLKICINNESGLLHVAVQNGSSELIRVLCSNGLVGIDRLNQEGKAPIHIAIEFNKNDLLRALIDDNGASTTTAYTVPGTETTYSPLAYAVKCGNLDAFDILIEEDIDASVTVEGIGNLLHVAIQFAQHDMLEHILQKYNNKTKHLIESSAGVNKTPLMLAASLDDIESISSLYKSNAALETSNSVSRTAMHFAAEFCKKDSINLLHYFGANLQAIDTEGGTPFSILKEENDFYCTTTRNLLLSLSQQRTATNKKPPNFSYQLPNNLIFKGGGAKGIAYLGAIKFLEETNKMREVHRITGTSAGALIATLLAFGNNAREIDDLLLETPLTKFLDHSFKMERIENGILENVNLSMMWDAFNYLIDPVGTLKNVSSNILFKILTKSNGICEGEVLREWIEEQIEKKTGIKYCTFGELKQFIVEGNPFRHLHVFGTKIGNNPSMMHFSSEDESWEDLIISDAVAISMSIPGVFKARTLHFKDAYNGNRYERSDLGFFVDSGLIYNFPLEAFDEKQYVQRKLAKNELNTPLFNRRTLGFALYSEQGVVPDQPVETVTELASALTSIYFNVEERIREPNNYNRHRIVEIADKGGEALIEQGYAATQKFIDEKKSRTNHITNTIDFTYTNEDELFTDDMEEENDDDNTLLRKKRYKSLPTKHDLFVERKKYINLLEKKLEVSIGHWKAELPMAPLALCGLSGVGKSELSVYFAHTKIDYFSFAYWISAENKETLYTSYRKLLEDEFDVVIDERTSFDDIRRLVFKKLKKRAIETNKPWLLIYENVEERIDEYPSGGYILATSIKRDIWNGDECFDEKDAVGWPGKIVVEFFEQNEALQLFENLDPDQRDENSVEKLIEAVGRLPLVLVNIIKHIKSIPSLTEAIAK